MHDFLRSIGFSSLKSKKQLQELTEWVLEKPDHLSVVSLDSESNLAVAEREVAGHAGIAVVGEMDEQGVLIPEYYYPYISSTHLSSDSRISYDKLHKKTGFIGMCEDFRMGMALIFNVRNITELYRNEMDGPFGRPFTKVNLSALASDGTVLLPCVQTEKAVLKGQDAERERLYKDACDGNQAAMEALASQETERFHRVMDRLHETDVFTVVDSFFMPHGMESDQYYFMGTINAVQKIRNELTGEFYYRMVIDANGMTVLTAINEKDLIGSPEPGYRLKCHAWLTGELKR